MFYSKNLKYMLRNITNPVFLVASYNTRIGLDVFVNSNAVNEDDINLNNYFVTELNRC